MNSMSIDDNNPIEIKEGKPQLGSTRRTSHQVLRHVYLGALMVKLKPLDNNKLSVAYPCGKARINSRLLKKSLPISDKLKDMIYGWTIRDESFDPHKYYALDTDEKRIVRSLLKHARLGHLLSGVPSVDEEEEQILNRFELLKGTILAGNSSKELLTELNQLLDTMLQYDLITSYLHDRILRTIYQTLAESK